MKHKIKSTIWLFFILAASVILVSACGKEKKDAKQAVVPKAPEVASVKVAAPVTRDFQPTIEATGSLVPQRHAVVAAMVDGRLDRMPVDIGTKVKQGGILFGIRVSDYRNAYDQARAAQEKAEAALEFAKLDKERTEDLYKRGYASAEQFDNSLSTHKQSEAALKLAKASAGTARTGLRDTVVRAPYDCVVTARYVEHGEYAKKGNQVVEIMDMSVLNAELEIPERFAGTIAPDSKVTLSCRAQPGTVTGKIVAINNKISTANRMFTVKVSVDNKDETLKAGLFCTATIQLPIRPGQLAIPQTALVREEGESTIWKVKDGKACAQKVTEGGNFDDGWVLIVDGMELADQVIVEGVSGLTEGAQVQIK